MNKKALSLISLTGLFTLIGSFTMFNNDTSFGFFADGCDHVGYQYDGLELTKDEYGVKPFCVCCKCHEHFIDDGNIPSGNWTKAELKLEQYKEIINLKDDRFIRSPYKALESESEFYNYFHFASWGTQKIPGEQMQIVSDNLYIVENTIFSESQLLGANYLRLKMHIDSSDERAPKRIVAFHGGGAADKESFANIDNNGDVIVTVNLKSYLYDINNSFKLALNLYVSDDYGYYENQGELSSGGHMIQNCTWTIKEVTPITEYNVEKGNVSDFEVKYNNDGVVTQFSFVDTDITTTVGWNGLMFKMTKSYWASLYDKGYRKLLVSQSYSINDGTAGIYNFANGAAYFPGNGATQILDLVEGGLDVGFGRVNHGTGRHYSDRVTYDVVVGKTEEELKIKTLLSSQDSLWRYFNFGTWGPCNPGFGDNASMSFIGGNILVTNNLFTDMYAAGMTHFEFDVEINLTDKTTYPNVNRWVYTTNNAEWNLVYAEGDYNGKTHIDIDFSNAGSGSNGESLYFCARVMDGSDIALDAPNCMFTISNVSCR